MSEYIVARVGASRKSLIFAGLISKRDHHWKVNYYRIANHMSGNGDLCTVWLAAIAWVVNRAAGKSEALP